MSTKVVMIDAFDLRLLESSSCSLLRYLGASMCFTHNVATSTGSPTFLPDIDFFICDFDRFRRISYLCSRVTLLCSTDQVPGIAMG